jgi:hypothetical protein
MKLTQKRKKRLIALAAIAAVAVIYHYTYGCHSITGTVIDEETGRPIEGAVSVCVWMKTGGLIEVTHSVAKVTEGVSDKKGRIKIKGTWRIGLDDPKLTIYKRGYVAWNNNELFKIPEEIERGLKFNSTADKIHKLTELDRRKDFAWKNGFVARLERWKEGYSFIEHEGFISRYTSGAQTPRFRAAIRWEREFQVKEMDMIIEKNQKEGDTR